MQLILLMYKVEEVEPRLWHQPFAETKNACPVHPHTYGRGYKV